MQVIITPWKSITNKAIKLHAIYSRLSANVLVVLVRTLVNLLAKPTNIRYRGGPWGGGLPPLLRASPRLYSPPQREGCLVPGLCIFHGDQLCTLWVPMGAIPKGQPKGQPPAGGGEIHSREGSQGAIVSPLGSSLEHSSPDGPPY